MLPGNVLLENSLNVFYVCCQNDGNIVYTNTLFNKFASHIVPENIEDFIFIAEDVEALKECMDKAVSTSPFPHSFQCRLRHKTGALRWSTWEVAYGNGVFHLLGIQLFDVVSIDSQRYEEQSRILENIAWIQSHKVRKPLANILALSELMAKSTGMDSDKLEVLSMLKTSSEELDEIVREIIMLCNSISE